MVATSETDFDVLIVGAGLSGVGAAYHLQKYCPDKSYAILEGRKEMGGTWDLFRYPGVRSDSDMFTLGYGFRPWREAKAIADGPSIKAYVKDTAAEYGIDRKIRFGLWVTDAAWSSADRKWTVTAKTDGGVQRFTCSFLWMCSGYYRYAEGYTPDWKDVGVYKGRLVHPQKWPEDLDYVGKRVVVIGSGATAVTLIPSMSEKAAHVVMLQRSPTYMFSMPGTSALAKFLSGVLPRPVAYWLMRWQRIILQQIMFNFARKRPQKTREALLKQTTALLPAGFDVGKHFTPSYNPWDQRLCLVPDEDLFAAIRSGKASVETDHIERFTETGVLLKSGRELQADIVVAATGLVLEALGGARITVDGAPVDIGKTVTYRGLMYSGVPNLASVFGYTNASWTLRADLVSHYVCRLINFMAKRGFHSATPIWREERLPSDPFIDFSSGYVTRAISYLPKQGPSPWRHPQNYALDVMQLKHGRIDDGFLEFSSGAAMSRPAAPAKAA